MGFIVFFSPSEDKVISQADKDFSLSRMQIQHQQDSKNDTIKYCQDKQIKILNKNGYFSNAPQVDFLASLWKNRYLHGYREQILESYLDTLRQILTKHDKILLKEVYGAKNFTPKNEMELNLALQQNTTLQAIERYCGVAFQALNFTSLSEESKDFICNHVYIFSNLFGVICARDKIPFYKLKQGAKIPYLNLAKVYEPFLPLLDDFLSQTLPNPQDFIIDLRASIYTKIFTPKQQNFFFEFQKENKIVSHYSKFYRGVILRLLSQQSQWRDSQNIDFETALVFFSTIEHENLRLHSITQKKTTTIVKYDIL
ncbi:peroxide stress protein YaaA [Helicobacter didelphidarum]|uniref:Peroxide stress protein YaaA n=1 Tax=Helicobacter didelphidarum TaxID=2040648 RepID=A0A3D8IGX8_9HELI|nr:peroxide stress protein YaaA [Helicobacter didelphidarum]RDU64235.1 peroxide stress protein YaaA [Helicobacter didelphidarum]